MRIIGARASDWRPGRPDVKLSQWIGGFVVAAVFYVAIAAAMGHLINGDGSPFLS
jgi:hypothetical protein